MNPTEIRNRIAAIQAEVKGFDLDSLDNDGYAKLVALDTERKGLEADLEKADNVARIAKEAKAHAEREGQVSTLPVAAPRAEVKSLGEQLFASHVVKVKGVESTLQIETKTLMTTQTGVTYPNVGNQGVIVLQPTAPTTLLDLLDVIPANPGTGYRFYAETVFQNNADTVAEGAAAPESALRLVEQTAGIYKVSTWIPATDEQLSDVPGAAEYIDKRIRDMVRIKAGAKVMSGNGTNDVLGVTNTTGILTYTKAAGNAETVLDAIYKGFTKVNAIGGPEDVRAVVNVVLMNPYDWQTLRLAKDGQGRYLLGDPAAAGVLQVWGVPVILDISLAQGTALAMDARFFKVLLGADLKVEQTNAHADYFIKDINAIKATMRLGVVPLRAAAAVTVTGLNA